MVEKQKQYNLAMDTTKVMGANISRYSDGYSYANISFKMSDKERMSVNYEWQGGDIPEFAMNVMEIMQTLGNSEKASADTLDNAEVMERAARVFMDCAAKMKKEAPTSEDEEHMEDEEDMKKEGKKKKDSKKC